MSMDFHEHFFVLVHPCDEAKNGGCSDKCIKLEEEKNGFVCSCDQGRKLKSDGKTCTKGEGTLYLSIK